MAQEVLMDTVYRLVLVDRPFDRVKMCKFIVLADGRILIGMWAFFWTMLSKYESEHGKRVPAVGAGEVDVNGNVLSWNAPSINVTTPANLRGGIQGFLQEPDQLTTIRDIYEGIPASSSAA